MVFLNEYRSTQCLAVPSPSEHSQTNPNTTPAPPLHILTQWTLRILNVKLTKFPHDVDDSSPLLALPSMLQYSGPFQNANTMHKCGVGQFSPFRPKIGCHGNVPSAIAKWRSHPWSASADLPFLKFGEALCGRSWYNWSPLGPLKKRVYRSRA